ncbi:hypothetical protein GCM10010398_35490 [Streptomyces fimbriatus]
MPGPFQPVHNAAKSFVQSFAEALGEEVRDTGVTITSFMPDATETEFFRRAGMADDTRMGTSRKDDPAQVAEQAFTAIVKGEKKAVTGSLHHGPDQGLPARRLRPGRRCVLHRLDRAAQGRDRPAEGARRPTGHILRDAPAQVVAVLVGATAVGTAVGLALGSAMIGKALFSLSAPAIATSSGTVTERTLVPVPLPCPARQYGPSTGGRSLNIPHCAGG